MKTRRETLGLGAIAGATLLLSSEAFAHGDEHAKGKPGGRKRPGQRTGHGPAKKGGHDSHAPEGKSVSLVGEVIDIVCYLQHPDTGQGPDHAGCARQCINKGLPAGLLSEGRLYLLMKPGHDPVVEELAPLAAKQVKATGVVIESGGFPALVYTSIARA